MLALRGVPLKQMLARVHMLGRSAPALLVVLDRRTERKHAIERLGFIRLGAALAVSWYIDAAA